MIARMADRTMKPVGCLAAAAALSAAVASAACAETKLTDFTGEWRGAGTDRDTPLEKAQPTNCRMTAQADLRQMRSVTNCDGQAGLRKVIHLTITLDGDKISGEASQTSTPRDGKSAMMKGAVSGRKTGDVANLDIRFPGLTPNAAVLLTRTSPSSFTMKVTSLGITLMDVTFRRPAGQ